MKEQLTPRSPFDNDALELAGRMSVPRGTQALLFDMDGVLLDTLQQDKEIVDKLAKELVDADLSVSVEAIRENFAFDLSEFWRRVLASSGAPEVAESVISSLVERHEQIRSRSSPAIHHGITQVIDEAREAGLNIAVVSNNPKAEVEKLLANVRLIERVDVVVGNDHPGVAKKPAPDCYLEAARLLSVDPSSCVVIEDSLLGAEAGSRAGCFVVGVATGGNSYDELRDSGYVSRTYERFALGGPTSR